MLRHFLALHRLNSKGNSKILLSSLLSAVQAGSSEFYHSSWPQPVLLRLSFTLVSFLTNINTQGEEEQVVLNLLPN